MNIEDSSDNEEEILIYAEFEDCVEVEKYRTIHVLGINEKTPVIQMDSTVFMGKYENALGTYMFFEDDPACETKDTLFDKLAEKNLKYKCKTQKVLNMQHAHITPKEGKVMPDVENKVEEPTDEVEPVTFKTVQEALDKIKQNWDTFTGTCNPSTESVANESPEIKSENVSKKL